MKNLVSQTIFLKINKFVKSRNANLLNIPFEEALSLENKRGD